MLFFHKVIFDVSVYVMVLMLLISCSFLKMQGNNGIILFLHSEQVFTQVKMKTQVFVLISKNISILT